MRLFYDEHYEPVYPRPITIAIHAAIAARKRLELAANAVTTLRAAIR
jgi:hypothetical protein